MSQCLHSTSTLIASYPVTAPKIHLQEKFLLISGSITLGVTCCRIYPRTGDVMDELEVLRAIYLLGSADLLQHFLTVTFGRLDKGESWDDDFELNSILQESIRNSADAMLLNAPESLAVSFTKLRGLDDDNNHNMANIVSTPCKVHENSLGINGLGVLNFTY
ncbi:hypothetical protein Cgig2_026748 [Carnegiea gigantea]|uniref:Gamma-tubulin complex component n=1 Tax=Carnegiea gigantea TaxID=171969 RepID=A0A9Q1JUG6_9CARY|nr:hypothetical protein Cgig2_026748 [Carnegiea gigantea]